MKPKIICLAIVLAAANSGCTVKRAAVGISPDPVDEIGLGTHRSQVERVVDKIENESNCQNGSRVYYSYDRGLPSAGTKEVVAQSMFVTLTFGLVELKGDSICQSLCQKGLLEVIYDKEAKVVAMHSHPNSYDVGWYCGAESGDFPIGSWVPLRHGYSGEWCEWNRMHAYETDRAKEIEAPADFMAETGCDKMG